MFEGLGLSNDNKPSDRAGFDSSTTQPPKAEGWAAPALPETNSLCWKKALWKMSFSPEHKSCPVPLMMSGLETSGFVRAPKPHRHSPELTTTGDDAPAWQELPQPRPNATDPRGHPTGSPTLWFCFSIAPATLRPAAHVGPGELQ